MKASILTEPGVCRWSSVAQIARQQLGWRMRALPYLYTAFFDANQHGCPVMRPLFLAFPQDQGIWAPSNTQFLIGDGLMVAPVTVVSHPAWPMTAAEGAPLLPAGKAWMPFGCCCSLLQ